MTYVSPILTDTILSFVGRIHKKQGKRLSILSLPEVQELYSVPQFSQQLFKYILYLNYCIDDQVMDLDSPLEI